MKQFFQLIRPRTLPLAVSVTLCGTALAARHGALRADVFALALATTLLLQILSNLANDYGDGQRGTDRLRAPDAPPRLSAGGGISPQRLKRMMAATATATVVCGLALLFAALPGRFARLVFAALGVLALAAATVITLWEKPPFGSPLVCSASAATFTCKHRCGMPLCCCPPAAAACSPPPCCTSTISATSTATAPPENARWPTCWALPLPNSCTPR